MNGYVIGNVARITIAFADANAEPKDPTTVTCVVVAPDGTETTYAYSTDAEVVKDAVGSYHVDLLVTAAGNWYYRWAGTGVVIAADEGALVGLPSMVLQEA